MSSYKLGLALPVRGAALQKHDYRVGVALHTVGDREDAVRQMGTEFAQLQNDLASQMGWTPAHPVYDETSKLFSWWHANMAPVLDEWQAFQASELGSWFKRFETPWDVIQSWQERLVALRDAARSVGGFELTSPDPQPLTQDAWDKASSGLASIGHFIKNVVYVLLILVGGVIVVKAFGAYRGSPVTFGGY